MITLTNLPICGSKITNACQPLLSSHSVFFTGRIAAGEGRFNSNSEVNINTEVKSIPVTKRGVYFAFRDQGACISLLAIKVSFFCHKRGFTNGIFFTIHQRNKDVSGSVFFRTFFGTLWGGPKKTTSNARKTRIKSN